MHKNPLNSLTGLALSLCFVPGLAQTQTGPGWCDGSPNEALPADCALEAPPLLLGFDYTPSASDPRMGSLSVTQSTPEGGLRDVTGPFDMAGSLRSPVLRDVNSDDLPELFVQSRPAAFDIWELNPDGFYEMAGRVRAQSMDQIEERGALIVGQVRDGNGVLTESAYLLDVGEIVTVFRMRIDPNTQTCSFPEGTDAAQDWLNTDVLLAECEARQWNE